MESRPPATPGSLGKANAKLLPLNQDKQWNRLGVVRGKRVLAKVVAAQGIRLTVASEGSYGPEANTIMAFLDKLKRKVQEPEPPREPTSREECDKLLDEAVRMALRLVEAHGHHFPFCLAITKMGERINFAPDDRDVRDGDVLFNMVRQSVLTAIRDRQLRAAALVRNVLYHFPNDATARQAVQVTLDHLRETRGCTCYLPYRIIDGRVIPGEIFATEPLEALFTDKATFLAGADGEIATR